LDPLDAATPGALDPGALDPETQLDHEDPMDPIDLVTAADLDPAAAVTPGLATPLAPSRA